MNKKLLALLVVASLTGCSNDDPAPSQAEPSNNAPVAVADAVTVTQGQDVTIDVLANDYDPDSDTLSIVQHDDALKLVGATLVYSSPIDDALGDKQLSYTISDGQAESTTAITVTVQSLPTDPNPAARGNYAGSDACKTCHAEQYGEWTGTRHATMLRKLYQGDGQDIEAPWGTESAPRTVTDIGGHKFTTYMKGDEYWITLHDAVDETRSKDFRVDAVGYRSQINFFSYDEETNSLLFLPPAYWPEDSTESAEVWSTWVEYAWYNPDGSLVSDAYMEGLVKKVFTYENKCAECHFTNFEIQEWGEVQGIPYVTKSNIWEAEFDTGCEKCHGPAAEHAATGNPTLVVNPTNLNGDNKGSECDQCHQSGTPANGPHPYVELPYQFNEDDKTQPGKHFNVGDNLSDFYAFNSRNIWFGTEYKRQSKSHLEDLKTSRHGALGMTCRTCHDPHTQKLRKPGDLMCTECHQQKDSPAHKMAVHDSVDCATCHLPLTKHSADRSKRYDVRAHRFAVFSPEDSMKVYDALQPFTLPDADPEHVMTKNWQAIQAHDGACYDNWEFPVNLKECASFDIMPNACSSCHKADFPTPGEFGESERQKLVNGQDRYQRFLSATTE